MGECNLVKTEPVWKRTLLDLSEAFFLIGGIVGLISLIMMIPISTIYPFTLQARIGFTLIIFIIVGIACSIEAFECYSFVSKRMLAKAGIRGIVIGAILISISLIAGSNINTQIVTASSILILIGGIICYIYRE